MSENKFINEVKSNQVISGIYKIENLINHKVYIGQSINIFRRWKDHMRNLKNNKQTHLYLAMKKYGIENFSFEIIKETYDRDYWEIFLIQIYHATDNKFGYNICSGGYESPMKSEKVKNIVRIYLEKYHNLRKNKNILCINTKEIKSSSDWGKLKYHIQFGHNKHIFYFNNFEIMKIKGLYFLKSDNLTNRDVEFYFNNLNIIELKYNEWYRSTRVIGGKISVVFTKERVANLKKSRSKQIIEKRKFIKCIESNEIYSSKEWVYMGYHDAYRVANGKYKMCHNLHFEYSTKEEYENFKNIEDKSCYELKRKINELVKNGQS